MGRAPIRSKFKTAKGRVNDRLDALKIRAETERQHRSSVRMVFAVLEANRRTAASLLAGGLAYRFFIWALPAGLLASSIFSLVADASNEAPADLAKELGMGAALAETVGKATRLTDRETIVLIIIGAVLMAWAAKSVWNALRVASQLAWRVPVEGSSGLVWPTLITTGVLLGLGAFNAAAGLLYRGGIITDTTATILVIVVITSVLTWAGRALPHADGVPWPDFLPGALLFALGYEGLRLLTALYLSGRLARADDLYGALGLAAVFMAYLYLLGRLVMLWLLVNAEWNQSRRPPLEQSQG
jgi:membrane protein